MKRLVLAVLLLTTAPVFAQDANYPIIAKRVVTLEKQMQAVQRKVFPGGDPKYFTPEIGAEPAAPAAPIGTPSGSAVSDLTARVDALEGQLRTITGQVEENQFKLRQLDEAMTKLRGDSEFRLNALEGHGAPPAAGAAPVPGAPLADATAPPPAPVATPKPDPVKPAPAATPDAQWAAAYKLYTAKDFAGAETAMTAFLAANAKSPLASKAQYWLGRSYMEDGAFAQAAKAFLDGYQKYPKGERAPDSLLWLGNALAALKKPDQACRALNELQSVYGDKLTPALKVQATKARSGAKCDA